MYASGVLTAVLLLLYNPILRYEYILCKFGRCIQLPLFKGKNLCTLDTQNYKGITLFKNFNRIFEILTWNRIEEFWNKSSVISRSKGAFHKGQSCIHITMMLQQTVSELFGDSSERFVILTVWNNGLVLNLAKMGIKDRTWCLIYKTYEDFK